MRVVFRKGLLSLAACLMLLGLPPSAGAQPQIDQGAGVDEVLPAGCSRMVYADVVALDQPFFWNRLGAVQPQGMMYALESDVVHVSQDESSCSAQRLAPSAGQVRLRRGKRPRPLVLRVNVGDCLRINFKNLLDPNAANVDEDSPRTRAASVHVIGMQYVSTIQDGGMNVGTNGAAGNGVVTPGGSASYTLYAEREGTFLMYSGGALAGGEATSGSLSAGLFGAVNVEPQGSEWYRSQVTRKDLELAAGSVSDTSFPVINYGATFQNTTDPYQCHRIGKPVLKMLDSGNRIVHSDLTAIITGPSAGPLPATYLSDAPGQYPNRKEPFREFTIIFHDEVGAVQAFQEFNQPDLQFTLHSVRDAFAINYGAAGAGAEVLANRLGVGPMHGCTECKYEEFFLSSWAVGDPAMVVDVPANSPCMDSSSDDPVLLSNSATLAGYAAALREPDKYAPCVPNKGPKATRAYYPDDPSNVYHSYLNDHVKYRNLLAGSDDHHIFHLHAHQWLHSPRNPNSSYLDSQAIGQGAGYTYEILHGGSGNLNRTPGDSIFHCHFYPHFAQGMWGLWRVHDVLEQGTRMGGDGRPAALSRALPDGEILAGTPIPAIVPLPTLPMAPLPGPAWIDQTTGEVQLPGTVTTNPGYPFFVPGEAGHRAPQPPLDFAREDPSDPTSPYLDGGLPRHVVLDGGFATSKQNRYTMEKHLHELNVNWLAPDGTPEEVVAMSFHAAGGYTTPTPTGAAASKQFLVNGRPAVAGAPYANPCPGGVNKLYKGADIQLDLTLNKAGWHFPQSRIIALWDDVRPTLAGTKAPEPLFLRAHENDCVEYWFTNLVPNTYHLDDFQVTTPTDVLSQHIHLVKFDVTASDGGGNGFNYEDGSFSPEEVQERIDAIRAANKCDLTADASLLADKTRCPEAKVHPAFPEKHDADCNGINDWLGAQTTIQRWYANQLGTTADKRTLRTVFTHDHFGPSTHQQTGLYAGLVIEPAGTTWSHNETGVPLNTRHDGGPTSWQAVIDGPNSDTTYREFLLEFADFQLAYEPGSPICPDLKNEHIGWSDPLKAINPAGRKRVGPPDMYLKPITVGTCPVPDGYAGTLPPPCGEAVSADDPGFGSVNYRSEPLALRVLDPTSNSQATGLKGDLSFAYESRTDRVITALNSQPTFYPPLTSDVAPGDPFTPLLRAYEGDDTRVRILVGAHEEEHTFTIHGMKWKAEPDDPNSGWRNAQMMGISEAFNFEIPPQPSLMQDGQFMDALYKPSNASEFQWNGIWGLLRFYHGTRRDLVPLPTNSDGKVPVASKEESYRLLSAEDVNRLGVVNSETSVSSAPISGASTGKATNISPTATQPVRIACPTGAPIRPYDVVAVAAAEVLNDVDDNGNPVTGLLYNSRVDSVQTFFQPDWDGGGEPAFRQGALHDPTAIMFVRATDLTYVPTPNGMRPRLNANIRREPLILRANKGECVQVTLVNDLPAKYGDQPGWNSMPMIVERFNANDVAPSQEVGLHPQLLYHDLRQSDGSNVGLNPVNYGKQTVAPGQQVTYHWYAGDILVNNTVTPEVLTPVGVEFGATGLSSSDPIKHSNKGAVGALIVEPASATWAEDFITEQVGGAKVDRISRASVTVNPGTASEFREFVLVFQDDVNLRYGDGAPVESLINNEDPTESAQKAINYRTDPVWYRIGKAPDTALEVLNNYASFHQVLNNGFIGGDDPKTPVFEAAGTQPTRFRVVHPGGHAQAHVFEVQGHIWEELPYTGGSVNLGTNASSEWIGTRDRHGAGNHFDALIKNGAGGRFRVTGDYLYRDYPSWLFYDGIWSLFRVVP
ncbi:MAG TPA: copper oxidase [Thermoanaerobaculia bacterium]